MKANLLPAILLVGPPHSGKSVLSYMLTMHLRQQQISHYLLRAVPDGEGDWFLEGNPDIVRPLRMKSKTGYSRRFVSHMKSVIESRMIPLLVDVGGKPQGDDQFAMMAACTHAILLYRNESELMEWRHHLDRVGVPIVAELYSDLSGQERIDADKPYLRGVITGLERDKKLRYQGNTFDAVAACVGGICRYDDSYLEQIHSQLAPYQLLTERELGIQIHKDPLNNLWHPNELAEAIQWLEPGVPRAIYGRGPVWLAAALAVRSLPSPVAFFDIRYGWLTVPKVQYRLPGQLRCSTNYSELGVFLEFFLPEGGIFEPRRITLDNPGGQGGVVLSGKLPRWVFAALARKFATTRAWVGIDDPKNNRVIIVQSKTPQFQIGSVLDRFF